LFDSLAGHVWLIRQEGDRLLSHRRDLRRLMLPGIQQQDPIVYDAIIRGAIAYYEGSPEGVDTQEAWLEAAYHRGFLPDKPVCTPTLTKRARSSPAWVPIFSTGRSTPLR